MDLAYYQNDSLLVAAFFADDSNPCYTEEGSCYQFELRVLDVNTGHTLGNLSLPEDLGIAHVNSMQIHQGAVYLTGDFVFDDGRESNVLRYWLHAASQAREEESAILGENRHHEKLLIYPNPVSNQLMINSEYPINSVSVFDLSEKEVVNIHNPDRVLSLSLLSSGTYLMIIKTQDRSYRHRIVKK